MNHRILMYKYILIGGFLTVFLGGIIWLILYLMPETGWLYWLDIALIVIIVILYIVLAAVLIAMFYLESHMNEITNIFKNICEQLLFNMSNLYRLFWEHIYGPLNK